MTLKTTKPENPQDFINKAKADSSPEDMSTIKDKSFLLKLPYPVWKKAKQKATEEDLTLHDFIIQQIKKGL